MNANTKDIASIAEKNQNLSCTTEIDKENNLINNSDLTDDEKIDIVAARVLKRFKPAFLELAK